MKNFLKLDIKKKKKNNVNNSSETVSGTLH